MRVVTEICSELGYGVVDGVGGHTECLRDRICPESQDRDMLLELELELEKVVGKGVPLQWLFSGGNDCTCNRTTHTRLKLD